MEPWVIHDLRRTARSLLSRAGVRPDISERVLGHAIAGVEGVYDRHSYDAEKADALNRLAALVGSIVNPPKDKVVQLQEERGRERMTAGRQCLGRERARSGLQTAPTAGKCLGAWLADIGVIKEDDERNLAPMHSFRHRAAQRMRRRYPR